MGTWNPGPGPTDGNDVFFGDEANEVADGGAGNDTLLGALGDDVLIGGSGDDTLDGSLGDDTLDGGDGMNLLQGGLGNDTYVTLGSDTIFEEVGGGIDTIRALIDYTLGVELENLVLLAGAFTGVGNTANNTITGNEDGNTLNGLGGDDVLSGAGGVDTLFGGDGADILDGGDADDTLFGDDQFGLAGGADQLFGGAGEDLLIGGVGNDSLVGGDGNDTLRGDAGADRLTGGGGDDLYLIDDSDTVVELVDGGLDRIETNFSFDMSTSPFVEDLFVGNSPVFPVTIVGNALNNHLIGSAAADALDGGAGNDRIEGGGGADTLTGGLGDDVFVVDGLNDAIVENAGGGADTIEVSLPNYSLAALTNVENLVFFATGGGVVGVGNAANNSIAVFAFQATSDTLDGGDGNDVLSGGFGDDALIGGAGADSLFGGADNDTLIGGAGVDLLAGDAGTDTADYSASALAVAVNLQTGAASGGDAASDTFASVENLIGSAFADVLTGRDGFANTLSGGDGNDVLSGGTGGADVMNGGNGIDTLDYSLSPNGVDVRLFSGAAAGGSANGDTYSSIENIIGAATKTDTLAGDANANQIWGGGGNETITGREGTDTLFGEAGNDTLLGGADSDILIGGIGADTLGGGVQDDTADYSASDAGVTVNLQTGSGLGGHAQGDVLVSIEDVIGSAFNDVIIGKNNVWDNVFDGRGGNDTYTGGLGNDVFVFRLNEGSDTITDFVAGGAADAVQLAGFGAGFDSFAEVLAAATQVGADTIIDFGGGQTLTLQNLTLGNLNSGDFIFGP